MEVTTIDSVGGKLTSLLYIHITLATDTETESPRFAQLRQCLKHDETHRFQMASKRVIT